MLEADYRPTGRPSAAPRPPLYPKRVQRLIYGFAEALEYERVQAIKNGVPAL